MLPSRLANNTQVIAAARDRRRRGAVEVSRLADVITRAGAADAPAVECLAAEQPWHQPLAWGLVVVVVLATIAAIGAALARS